MCLKTLVEETDDNPNFAKLVCSIFEEINPENGHRIRESFSLHRLDVDEVERYLSGHWKLNGYFRRIKH